MHSMCEKALNRHHEYLSKIESSMMPSMVTHESSGKLVISATKYWKQAFQCAKTKTRQNMFPILLMNIGTFSKNAIRLLYLNILWSLSSRIRRVSLHSLSTPVKLRTKNPCTSS